MAYLNLLAAVDPNQVDHLRLEPSAQLAPSKIVGVSNLLSSTGWILHPPLLHQLAEILEGGQLLSDNLWHPYRVPKYHLPGDVVELSARLDEVWNAALTQWHLSDDDWYRIEIEKVVEVLHHAVAVNEGLASFLVPPADWERAKDVVIPIAWN